MKIDIDRIKVDETSRIRQDIGDLSELQESIAEVGLINPILIDEQDRLIAGHRRLTACKNLEWKEIEVNVVELEDDELKMLEAEAAENMFRKDFTPEEILAIQKRREEIAEARRPKGIFERFWIWLKALFAPKPEKETKPEPAPEPTPEPVKPETAAAPAEETAENAENSATPEDKPNSEGTGLSLSPSPEEETQEDQPKEPEPKKPQEAPPHIPKQPASAEIVEENGVRHIKWR